MCMSIFRTGVRVCLLASTYTDTELWYNFKTKNNVLRLMNRLIPKLGVTIHKYVLTKQGVIEKVYRPIFICLLSISIAAGWADV